MNTLDETELAAARDLLIKQKPLVQAYVIDQVRDKMIGGEAALGVIYSGEAISLSVKTLTWNMSSRRRVPMSGSIPG